MNGFYFLFAFYFFNWKKMVAKIFNKHVLNLWCPNLRLVASKSPPGTSYNHRFSFGKSDSVGLG